MLQIVKVGGFFESGGMAMLRNEARDCVDGMVGTALMECFMYKDPLMDLSPLLQGYPFQLS